MKRFVRKITESNFSAGFGVRGFGDVSGTPATGDDVDNAHIERVVQGAEENNKAVQSYVTNNTFVLDEPQENNYWSKTGGKGFSGLSIVKRSGKSNLSEEASANAIAGLGVGPKGEPGVTPSRTKYKKRNEQETPIMQNAINRRLPQPMFEVKRGMFAGNETFIVPENVFHAARMEKRKGEHWTKYLQETDYGRAISAHARKNRKNPIILQCEKTGYMCYAKYGSK
jgi:hypothetical protein